ncbi:hypothetical protein VTH82DRAFT_3023 [Thermothelomyces myriococcoides]
MLAATRQLWAKNVSPRPVSRAPPGAPAARGVQRGFPSKRPPRKLFASAVTVALNTSRGTTAELQEATIDHVQNWMGLGKRNTQRPLKPNDRNAAVVLASRSLAAWLDDDGFLARLLAASGMADVRSANVSVLTAAVDEVPRYDRRIDHYASSEGISILRGNDRRILPFFPLTGAATPDSSPPPILGGTHPPPGSLEFRPPPKTIVGPQRVYVPLANTVFANGREHTITASQWWFPNQMRIGSQLPLLMQKTHLKEHTVVLPPDHLGFPPTSGSTVTARVVPVTPARKVANSMGNILSKLEVDGQSVPASEELERIVPELLKAPRKLRDGDQSQAGPANVWALLIPPEYAHNHHILQPLQLANYNPDQEWSLAQLAAFRMHMYLACGCRLHKVLSGGGGWGPKQGLLSLDPKTDPLADDDQNLQDFIDSFSREYDGSVDGANGDNSSIAPPGWYVQFFVEAAYPGPEQYLNSEPRNLDPEERPRSVTTVFGTPGAVVGASPLEVVRSYPGLFGGVSSEGVYLVKRLRAQQALLAREERFARRQLQLAAEKEKEKTWEEVKAEEKKLAEEEKEAVQELQALKTPAAEEKGQPKEQKKEEEKKKEEEQKKEEKKEEQKKEEEKKEEEKKEEEKKEEEKKEEEAVKEEEQKTENKEKGVKPGEWIAAKMDTPRSYIYSLANPFTGATPSRAKRPRPSAAPGPRFRPAGRRPRFPQSKPGTTRRATFRRSSRRPFRPRPRFQKKKPADEANGPAQNEQPAGEANESVQNEQPAGKANE